MEVICIVLTSVFIGLSAVLVLSGDLVRTIRIERRRRLDLFGTLAGRLEVVGHWVPLIRLGNLGPFKDYSERFRNALAGTRLASLTRRACVALMVVGLLSFTLLGGVVSLSPLGAIVGVMAAGLLLGFYVSRRERAVSTAAAAQMPEVLRSLSAALGVGKSLPQAIEHVGRNVGEPLGTEFLKASFEIKSGCLVDAAVTSLCERVKAPGMALLGTSLQISQRTGSSLNELFAQTALMVAEGVSLRRELDVKTSQVRLSAKIVALTPVLLASVLILLSPDYRSGLAMPLGRMCLCSAIFLDLLALGIIRRQVKGVFV